MNEKRRTGRAALTAFLLGSLAASLMLMGGMRGARRVFAPSALDPVPVSSASAEQTPWHTAAKRVTEDRGEPTGRQAKVEVPSQLRHYSDTRRFLAIQVAEWREHSVGTPHDYAGLARMIRAGELVEVPAATENYLLYGVGALADAEPFTHFDKSAGKSVTIFDEAGLAGEYARLDESAESIRAEIDSLKKESDALGKGERARRASLRTQITQQEKALEAERERAELLEFFYRDAGRRDDLSAELGALGALAVDFHGSEYDLGDARARKEMKVRMLAHLRPEALAVMKELAGSYRERFGRPLPITSLVRPDEYQHRLSRSNANATRIETPPHSTGLAFDILYRHMTAEEQEHLMADIARLRDEGRVEALRENRDHFHVFAFIDGRRPGEDLIAQSLGRPSAPKRVEESRPAEQPTKREVAKAESEKASKTRAAKKTRTEVAAKSSKPSGRSASAKRSGGRASAR